MVDIAAMLRRYTAYFFIVVGIVWAAMGALTGTVLLAWPAVACIAGGLMVKLLPGRRLTWSWGLATASMGLIVSLYQVYAWAPLLGGAFSAVAGTTMVAFLLFALVHVLLFYAGAGFSGAIKSETS
ncbi:MAG: hypothetical protein JRN08_07550 [Nitrososphaerota archaeon]|nr:hypothetical protein [Nitrososphaerota archaeon]